MYVIEINHIELATEEDHLYEIDKWATFFKLETGEELKAMAATNQYMQSAAGTIFELSSDENIRELCRRRAEYEADQNAMPAILPLLRKRMLSLQKRMPLLMPLSKKRSLF